MFIDERTLNPIHADLDATVIHATLRRCDLIPAFMEVLKDTPEYEQMVLANIPPSYALEDEDSEWWESDDAMFLLEDLFDTLNGYAPEGYHFGSLEGDASDFGFWKWNECDM